MGLNFTGMAEVLVKTNPGGPVCTMNFFYNQPNFTTNLYSLQTNSLQKPDVPANTRSQQITYNLVASGGKNGNEMVKDSVQAIEQAIGKAKDRLEQKNQRFEKLRLKLELKISQDKVMKSLLISKKMVKLFGEIVKILDQINELEEKKHSLEKGDRQDTG